MPLRKLPQRDASQASFGNMSAKKAAMLENSSGGEADFLSCPIRPVRLGGGRPFSAGCGGTASADILAVQATSTITQKPPYIHARSSGWILKNARVPSGEPSTD